MVLPTQTKDEDFSSYSLGLSATDPEDNNFTYNATSNNTNLVNVVISGNSGITFTAVANASGTTTVDMNVTQDNNSSLYDSYSFTVTINAVNDAPTIITNIADFSLAEDNGTTTYDLNITDLEGDDLNITVESNNTSIITVESNNTSIITVDTNWTNYVNFATYTAGLDFNLTTVGDANGIVRITVNAFDDEFNTTKTFDVNVTAVNDAPTIDTNLSQTLAINEDNGTIVWDVNISDREHSDINFTIESNNTNIITVVPNWDGNLSFADYNNTELDFNITTVDNAHGSVRLTLKVDDGNLSSIKYFDINVTAVNDPTIISLFDSNTTANYSMSENNTTIITITANDDENDTISYTISGGADSGLFDINSSTGVLTFIGNPDYEEQSNYI